MKINNSNQPEKQLQGILSIWIKFWPSSSKADSELLVTFRTYISWFMERIKYLSHFFDILFENSFHFNYSCTNKWIAIVMYVIEQLKMNLDGTTSAVSPI